MSYIVISLIEKVGRSAHSKSFNPEPGTAAKSGGPMGVSRDDPAFHFVTTPRGTARSV
jgi:hypothetical protein